MSASKDTKRGTWKVYIRYKDWQGVGQVHTKRGFATKREALEYEREFLLKKSKDVNMGFPQFVEVLYGRYEAEVEIEHIFDQEAHYGNKDYSLF